MKRLAPVLCVLFAALGAAAAGKVYSEKGLWTGRPGWHPYTTDEPGSTKPLPRPYPGAPPLIPHSIEGLTTARGENSCLNCHLEGMEVAEGHKATKIPPSHFVNPFTGEKRTDTVVGMRYNCRQCHAPQAPGAVPPVPQKPAR